ncbi:MAG: hypothetical protein CM15mP125_3480 [Gammaproteobacteria bacterium]|nr:MAG: hypothetical protein CM15mP125_3480 [Gammaproteobacteria bacterium]
MVVIFPPQGILIPFCFWESSSTLAFQGFLALQNAKSSRGFLGPTREYPPNRIVWGPLAPLAAVPPDRKAMGLVTNLGNQRGPGDDPLSRIFCAKIGIDQVSNPPFTGVPFWPPPTLTLEIS